MHPVGFEPTIPASARLQTYALDRAVTGIGETQNVLPQYFTFFLLFLDMKLGMPTVMHIPAMRVRSRQLRNRVFRRAQNFTLYGPICLA
jgi:hypothetical protein